MQEKVRSVSIRGREGEDGTSPSTVVPEMTEIHRSSGMGRTMRKCTSNGGRHVRTPRLARRKSRLLIRQRSNIDRIEIPIRGGRGQVF